MAEPTYGKPCMSNLPPDLGQRIIVQIANSTPPDREKIRQTSSKMLDNMKAKRQQEYAAGKK